MFDNPTVRFFARSILAAIVTGLGVAVGALDDGGISTQEAVNIAYIALGAFATFAGVSAVTPIDKSVGVGK